MNLGRRGSHGRRFCPGGDEVGEVGSCGEEGEGQLEVAGKRKGRKSGALACRSDNDAAKRVKRAAAERPMHWLRG
jgi:hypothetical protein